MCVQHVGYSEEGRVRVNGVCVFGCREELVGQLIVEREREKCSIEASKQASKEVYIDG